MSEGLSLFDHRKAHPLKASIFLFPSPLRRDCEVVQTRHSLIVLPRTSPRKTLTERSQSRCDGNACSQNLHARHGTILQVQGWESPSNSEKGKIRPVSKAKSFFLLEESRREFRQNFSLRVLPPFRCGAASCGFQPVFNRLLGISLKEVIPRVFRLI